MPKANMPPANPAHRGVTPLIRDHAPSEGPLPCPSRAAFRRAEALRVSADRVALHHGQREAGNEANSRAWRGPDDAAGRMTGRASPAKAAVGDKPVFAYISSLPQPQRSIAERVDALAAKTLPARSDP